MPRDCTILGKDDFIGIAVAGEQWSISVTENAGYMQGLKITTRVGVCHRHMFAMSWEACLGIFSSKGHFVSFALRSSLEGPRRQGYKKLTGLKALKWNFLACRD